MADGIIDGYLSGSRDRLGNTLVKACPKCQKSARTSERIGTDTVTAKNWLITICARCGYNYDLEEYKGIVLSPEEEMNRYPWPMPPPESTQKYWPTI